MYRPFRSANQQNTEPNTANTAVKPNLNQK